MTKYEKKCGTFCFSVCSVYQPLLTISLNSLLSGWRNGSIGDTTSARQLRANMTISQGDYHQLEDKPNMSSHRRSFQCFNAIGGEGCHGSSLSRHTSKLPRISRHGMVSHHEPLEECYLCTEYRHALEARDTHASFLCHAQPHHHHHSHQYILRGPNRPEEPPVEYSVQNRHARHHRYNKKVVLVKNSDPSFQRTIILHRRTLRSLGLFLEEVSDLMQYHIRKLYTLEGRKIDSVQSLLQCPTVLVCVGREPSHSSILENFRKTVDDKLPQLSSHSTGWLDTKKNVIHPKLESKNISARQSMSTDKSLPDEADSPEHADPCPHTDEAIGDDDIEKRVLINKDGSLSMQMKVRFRLLNDETLHWSTEVKKTTAKTSEYSKGHNSFYNEQVSNEICSESDNTSLGEADKAFIIRRYQKHIEEPHCPHCCHHCQEYDVWKNLIPGTQGASCHIRSSSSSASSHTKVCQRKMVESRKTMSASSLEEYTEQVMEKETPKSAKSNTSAISKKSKASEIPGGDSVDIPEEGNVEENTEDRAASSMSAKSGMTNTSAKSSRSKVSNVPTETSAAHHEEPEERAPSSISVKSAKSNASAISKKSKASEVPVADSVDIPEEGNVEEDIDDRAASSMSAKSGMTNTSAKSSRSKVSNVPTEESAAHHEEPEERAPSSISAAIAESKSNVSKKTKNGPLENTDCSSKSNKSSKCRHKRDTASEQQRHDDALELVPSSLPNASPTEVVNEWLKRIPVDNDIYDVVDDFNEDCEGPKNTQSTEELHKINRMGENGSIDVSVTENTGDPTEADGVVNNIPNNDCQTNTESPNADNACAQKDDAKSTFHSSVQVMKILLSPKLDRCNSLPEVSPVYGRKLSTSAKGLLDCLVKLQLIHFDPQNAAAKDERYQELMNILQSLWLCDPSESEQILKQNEKVNDEHSVDDDSNRRSSSGVDVNSGSTGSRKSSVNGGVTQVHAITETLKEVQEVSESEEEAGAMSPGPLDLEIPNTINVIESAKEEGEMNGKKYKEDDHASDDTIRSNDSPKELPETPPSSKKSSGNDSSSSQNLPDEGETECQLDMGSESPPLVQRAQLTKKISHDPDPVWVLNLLSKLEKQFMTHYINAMTEFKVRWNLDDNEQLDVMINELKNEVHKRIQTSINQELKKIQSRAGQPRPPKEPISRESTTQTEERRRRLRIMIKQSIDGQAVNSDDDYTATNTSYSDQRSENDDEYCPCETCMRKKMASRLTLPAEVMPTAPVLMDFDLKTILALKNSEPGENTSEVKTAGEEETAVIAEEEPREDNAQVATDEDATAVAETIETATTGNELTEEDTAADTDGDGLAEEMAEAASADDEMAEEETTEAATTKNQSDKEETTEAGEDEDGEETAATNEDNTAESMDAITTEDETAEENDDTATADELSKDESEEETSEVATYSD
uniref:Doublecortin domain-containing protein n=1 Tax=Myripristis murdjan TaxID=586833 RepID=A0A668AG98_9TELE